MPEPAPQNTSDESLAAQVARRDEPAFAALVKRHTSRFYKVAYGVVLNREDAEDVVQDAFLKLWNGKARWEEGRNNRFTTWFYRVVYNQALDHLRRKPPFRVVMEDVHPSGDLPADEAVAERQQSAVVDTALRNLPERQRSALMLVYTEGLPQAECAAVMGITVKALESLLSRGKASLKEQIKHYDGRNKTDHGTVGKTGTSR